MKASATTVTAFLIELALKVELPPFSDARLAARIRTCACQSMHLEEADRIRRRTRQKKNSISNAERRFVPAPEVKGVNDHSRAD